MPPNADFNRSFSFLPSILPAQTFSADGTPEHVIPADEYFFRLCARYLDRLAQFEPKESAKFVRRACADQGDALKWVLLVAEHSTFVGIEVIRRFSRAEALDFRDQPQLFVTDPNHATQSLSESGTTPTASLPPIFKVFRVLQEEKRTRYQQTLTKSSETPKPSPTPSSVRSHGSTKESTLAQSHPQKSKVSVRVTEATPPREIPKLKTVPALPVASSPPTLDSFLLPCATSLNFKGCASLTLSTLSIVLRHTPNLEALCLDLCAYVTNDLWLLLKKQRNRSAIRLKRLSLAYCVCISDSFFSNMASAELLKDLRSLNISHCKLVTNASLRPLSQHCTKLEEAVRYR